MLRFHFGFVFFSIGRVSCWSNAMWKYTFFITESVWDRVTRLLVMSISPGWLLLFPGHSRLLDANQYTTLSLSSSRTRARIHKNKSSRRRRRTSEREKRKTMKTITLCCCLFISNLHHIKIVFGPFFPSVVRGFICAAFKNYMCLFPPLLSSYQECRTFLWVSFVGCFVFFSVIKEQRPKRVADDIHLLSFSSSIGCWVYRFWIDFVHVKENQRD